MNTRTYAKHEAIAKFWTDHDMDSADFHAHRDELEKLIAAAYIEDDKEARDEAMIDRLIEEVR